MKENTYMLNRSQKLDSVANILALKNIFMISARPGQGKTDFALAMAKKYFSSFIYYRFTNSDLDPVYFCRSLHSAIKASVPGYTCSEFEKAVAESGSDPLMSEKYIKMILKSLKKILKSKTVIILDDAYILSDIGVACFAVMTGLTVSGGLLSFIICSRRNCKFTGKFATLEKSVHRLTDDFMRLTQEEFRQFCIETVPDDMDISRFQQVFTASDGWLMGTVSLVRYLTENRDALCTDSLSWLFSEYFSSLIAQYPPKQISMLMLLSLPDHFSIDAVRRIDKSEKLFSTLNDMISKNIFIRISGERIFFSRPFRSWLRQCAASDCSKQERSEIYINSAMEEEHCGSYHNALRYLLLSESPQAAEKFVRNNFTSLISDDTYKTLYETLCSADKQVIMDCPWTALLLGAVSVVTNPQMIGDIFLRTYNQFKHLNDEPGLIMSLFGLVFYHSGYVGSIRGGEKYIDEIRELKDKNLDIPDDIKALSFMLSSFYYGRSGKIMKTALETILHPLFKKPTPLRSSGYITALRLSLAFPDKKITQGICDVLIMRLDTTYMSGAQKLWTMTAMAMHDSIYGSFETFPHVLAVIKTKLRPYTEIFSKSMALADFFAQNIAICGNPASIKPGDIYIRPVRDYDTPDYLRALRLLMNGVVSAFTRQPDAVATAMEGLSLMESMNVGIFFKITARYMIGVTCAFNGNFKQANEHLSSSAESAEAEGFVTLAAAAAAHLSYINHCIGNRQQALERAVYAARLFLKSGYTSYLLLTPETALNMWTYASRDKSAGSFAEKAAYERYDTAFTEDKTPVPVLKINCLDRPSVSVGSETLDLTSIGGMFRQFLAIIVSAKGYQMEQEVIQSLLWPDKGREQSRRSFDNLLSRFRKLLSDRFFGLDTGNYIILSSGTLRLINIKCDADRFIKLVRDAGDKYVRGEYKSMGDNLIKAIPMFRERYFPDISGFTEIDQKRRNTDAAFISMIRLVKKLSFFMPAVFDIEPLFDRWMDTFMTDTDMVSMAYRHYRSAGKTQKAKRIITDFSSRLMSDGYTDDEINELIYVIRSSG